MAREVSEWERYKEINDICPKVGCNQLEMDDCNPDLRKNLCFPKKELLKKLNVQEEELKNNEIKLKSILSMIKK